MIKKSVLMLTLLLVFSHFGIKDASASQNQYSLQTSQNGFLENSLNGSIQINNFDLTGRMTGDFQFSVRSKNFMNLVLFLPSAVGIPVIENTTSETELGFYEFHCLHTDFQGKLYSNGIYFPWDSYELMFIFGFNKDFSIQRVNVKVSFGDLILYADWVLDHVVEKISLEQVGRYVNYIALSDEEFKEKIEAKNLLSFYVINAKVTRTYINILKLSILWIPPVLLLLALIISTLFFKKMGLANGIRLYTGSGFFLATYLFSLRGFTPPTLTWLDGVVALDMFLALFLMIIVLLHESEKMRKFWSELRRIPKEIRDKLLREKWKYSR